jgi:protoporphyrinogen oxidase
MSDPVLVKRKACVIGAGVTGLVAACSLARSGFDVTVLESELHPGGMLSTFRIGWEDLERIPHLIDPGDRDLLKLFRDLGLESQIEWFQPTAALYLEGSHQRITKTSDLLKVSTLPVANRLVAAFRATRRRLPPFLCAEALRSLLSSRPSADSVDIPGEWLVACPSGLGPRTGSVERAGYPAGGFSILVRALLKEIAAFGGELRYGCTVTDIRPLRGGFRLDCILEDCTSYFLETGTVVATVSGRRFAEMTAGAGLAEVQLDRLRSTRYQGHLCLALRLKQSLSPYHRTLVPAEAPFRLVTEHSGLVGLRRYGGHIVYLSRDIDTADPLWSQSDGEIFRLFFRRLSEMNPELLRSDVKDWRLTRKRYSCPLRPIREREAAFRSNGGYPGLFLAGLARSLPEEHSLDHSVRAGLAVAARVSSDSRRRNEGAVPTPGIPQSEVD